YVVRGYRHRRKDPAAGHYPVKLRHDILGVLRFERPDLADALTLAHVTAAIQYHLRAAAPNRPMGEKLCAELHRVRRRKPASLSNFDTALKLWIPGRCGSERFRILQTRRAAAPPALLDRLAP